MKQAVIDVTGEVLPRILPVMDDAGLRVIGSMERGLDPFSLDQVRLIVQDPAGTVLPDRCVEQGFWLVTMTFQQESYGKQAITKVQGVELVGRLTFGIGGVVKTEAA